MKMHLMGVTCKYLLLKMRPYYGKGYRRAEQGCGVGWATFRKKSAGVHPRVGGRGLGQGDPARWLVQTRPFSYTQTNETAKNFFFSYS